MRFTIYSLSVIWVFSYIILLFYLYYVNKKPYKTTFLEEKYDKVPSSLTPSELSMLLYKKMIPSVFTANFLLLIENGIVAVEKRGNDYLFLLHECETITDSQKELTILLFHEIGDGDIVYLSQIERFCMDHSGCSTFLSGYQLWKSSLYREVKYQFYEQKKGYTIINIFRNAAIFLIIVNFLTKTNSILVYLLLFPAYFLYLYFYKIYKRTEAANDDYYKWLGYKHYLVEKSKFTKTEERNASIYGLILKCISVVEKKLPEHEYFILNLELVITKCIHRAILRGDRSIKIWNLR